MNAPDIKLALLLVVWLIVLLIILNHTYGLTQRSRERLRVLVCLSNGKTEEIDPSMLAWYRRVRNEELEGKRHKGERFYDELELVEWEMKYIGRDDD